MIRKLVSAHAYPSKAPVAPCGPIPPSPMACRVVHGGGDGSCAVKRGPPHVNAAQSEGAYHSDAAPACARHRYRGSSQASSCLAPLLSAPPTRNCHAGDATGAGTTRAMPRERGSWGPAAHSTVNICCKDTVVRSTRLVGRSRPVFHEVSAGGASRMWAPALHARAHNRRRRFLWRRLLTLCGRLPLGSRGCRAFPPAPPARARARCEKNQQVVAYGGHLIGNVSWASYKGTAAEGRRGYSPLAGQIRQREAHLARRYAPTLDVCRLGATNVLPSSVP